MTLKALIESHVSTVFLNTDHFADGQIIRYIGGDVGQIKYFTGQVTWGPAVFDSTGGRATVQTGEVWFSASVEMNKGDALNIEGNRVEVTGVDAPQYGAKTARFTFKVPETKGAAPLRTGGF